MADIAVHIQGDDTNNYISAIKLAPEASPINYISQKDEQVVI